MKAILLIFVIFLFTSTLQAATIYKWVDEKGVKHFTDDYNKIPPKYRDRVMEGKEDVPKAESPTPQPPPQKIEEAKKEKDIFGLDEEWWREKARPWKEQLKEATENYETTNKKIVEKSETISRKYWSPTQYKMNMLELDRLKEERVKYQAKIDEANEMLKRLAKESEDAKANPDWVK